MSAFSALLAQVHDCRLCAEHLPHAPRPMLQLHSQARVLIAGQAPGRKAYEAGVLFDDASGNRLRDWMGVSHRVFYDPKLIAILPMGFCYPGAGKSGDLPPRPECAATWHAQLLEQLRQIEITLVIGQYAQQYHLDEPKLALTEIVRNWRNYAPRVVPLPHPSPRNNIWLRQNPWFERELLPVLRKRVATALSNAQ